VIFGGVGQNPQVHALRHGTDIIVATPGRLLDLMNQGHSDFRHVEVLVLDEADRMLDMGFINDIRKIVSKLPAQRQTLMFSATMPPEIRQLAQALLKNPVSVQVAPVAQTADKVDQSVYFVDKRNKPQLLAHLVNELPMTRAIVFTRTKHGADRVVRHLHKSGIKSEAIHGNKSQNARQRALDNFKREKIPVLVATDIAARGIDVDGITHVVNYDLTHEPETYVHRIGRTARAGAGGAAVSFCDAEERQNLQAIQRLIRQQIPVKTDHPAYSAKEAMSDSQDREPRNQQRQDSRGERHPARHPSSRQNPHAAPRHSGPASARSADGRRSHGPGGSHGQPAAAPRSPQEHQSSRPATSQPAHRRSTGGKPAALQARHPLYRQSHSRPR
jgi:ATP-dependent RNA helicase RhlE